MERNNRARRPSMAGKMSPEPKTLSINGPDPCSVPCSSQGTAAAAGSYTYFNDDTFSDLTKEFDCPFGIEGDNIYLISPLPLGSLKAYDDDDADFVFDPSKMFDENEELNDHAVKCQSSEINNSYKETTVNNDETSRPDASVDPQNFSNSIEVDYNEVTCQPDEKLEIDNHKKDYEMSQPICLSPSMEYLDVTSMEYLDHILQLDYDMISGNDNLSNLPKERSNESNKAPGSSLFLGDGDQCDCLLPTMISDKGKTQTSFHSSFEIGSTSSHPLQIEHSMLGSRHPPKASRPSSSAGSQSISLEPHNLHVRFEVTVPKFIVEVPRTDSSGFLKKAILDKVTAMELRTSVPIAYSINSVAAIICSEVNGSLDLVPGCQKVNASKSKKRLVMDVNSLDGSPVPHKAKSSKNEKRRKIEFFSTSEVEALVQLVEEHGTGRWAEIKEQAFGRDSKRTRTDLRDKWRSLVKTAKIPVDKRKGEKLPQVLLDKVVAIETRNSQCRDIQK